MKSRLTASITPGSEYDVSSMTWHQWHQTAEIERRIGLSSSTARAKACGPHGSQAISPARFGRGEKRNSLISIGCSLEERRNVKDGDNRIQREPGNACRVETPRGRHREVRGEQHADRGIPLVAARAHPVDLAIVEAAGRAATPPRGRSDCEGDRCAR